MDITINTQHFDLTANVETAIRDRAERLEKFHPNLIHCIVTVEGPSEHHQHGGTYDVRLEIRLPGPAIVINRQPNEDLGIALRDAFEAAKRRIEDHNEKLRGPRGHERRHGSVEV